MDGKYIVASNEVKSLKSIKVNILESLSLFYIRSIPTGPTLRDPL